MDFELLYRLEFAIISTLHYIYPAITIGLASVLVTNNFFQIKSSTKEMRSINLFWTQITGIAFVLGLVSGFITQYQIQNHWPGFARSTRELFNTPLEPIGYIAMLGATICCLILIFFEKKTTVQQRLFLSVGLLVCFLGTSFRIIAINSWMQTPGDVEISYSEQLPILHLRNQWDIVKVSSFAERIVHIWSSGALTGAFLAMSWFAYGVLKKRKMQVCKLGFQSALTLAIIASIGQLGSGHISASSLAKTQPAKLSAFEGHFKKDKPGDMYLMGWVDNETHEVKGIKIKGGLSFLLYHNFKTKIPGIEAFDSTKTPKRFNEIFQAYHAMVGIGFTLFGLLGIALWLSFKKKLFNTPLLLKVFVLVGPLPLLASIAGWFATEIGRQPYLIMGILTREQAIAEDLSRTDSIVSLVLNLFFYSLMCIVFVISMHKLTKRVLLKQ